MERPHKQASQAKKEGRASEKKESCRWWEEDCSASWVFSTFEYETGAMSYQSVGVSLRIRSTPRESKEWIFRVPIPYEKKLGMDRCNPEILGPPKTNILTPKIGALGQRTPPFLIRRCIFMWFTSREETAVGDSQDSWESYPPVQPSQRNKALYDKALIKGMMGLIIPKSPG